MNASELTTISAEELKPVHLPGAIIPAPPEDSDTSIMRIEIGPAHPAMHGIVRLTTYLDGEQIVGMVPEIGYLGVLRKSLRIPSGFRSFLHRCLNYVSPVPTTSATQWLLRSYSVLKFKESPVCRVIMGEISRIRSSHLSCRLCNGSRWIHLLPLVYRAREYLYELLEQVTGGRVTINWTRFGGNSTDFRWLSKGSGNPA